MRRLNHIGICSALWIWSIGVSSAVAQVVTPISRWHFDEAGGTTAFDSVGSINGTLMNGATFVPGGGISGGALSLDMSTNGFVTMGDHFGFTSSFSVQAWIRTAPGDTSPMIPVGKHRGGIGVGYFLGVNQLNDGNDNSLNKAHFFASSNVSGSSLDVVNNGAWHQLVGVAIGNAGPIQIYVDGQLQSTSGSGVTYLDAAADFMVGGYHNGTNPQGFFTGLIDEVAVFDRALTSSEVLALYNSVTVPEPTSLLLLGGAAVAILVRRRVNFMPIRLQ